LRVREHRPGDIGALPDVGPTGAEAEQSIDLLLCGRPVRPKVEMKSVLDGLAFRDLNNVDGRPRRVRRRDADDLVFLLDDAPAERGRPELGDRPWLMCIDRD